MRFVWLRCGLAAALVLASSPALAQSGPVHPHDHDHGQDASSVAVVALDPATVRSRAEAYGPGVRPSQVGKAQAARTRSAVNVALSHPPRLEIDVARRSYPGGSGVDVSGRLWQDVSVGGYGRARAAYADAIIERSKSNVELARRDAISRAMLAWVDARYAREVLALRKQSLEASEQMLRIAESRLRAGTAQPAEVALARSIVGASRASILAAEGLIVQADGDLRYAVALAADARLAPTGELIATDDRAIDEPRAIQMAQSTHPAVTQARTSAQAAERSAEVFVAAGKPFIGVGVSYTREATGDQIVGGMVSVPLPFVNPNALESSVLRSEAAVGRAQVVDIQAQVAREVRQAIHECYHSRQVREELRVGAVAPGREALKETIRRYEGGAVELISALSARREVLTVEEAFLAAAADVQRSDIRLEHVVGATVPKKSSP